MDCREIIIKNKKISIPNHLLEKCEKYGVDIYGEYADKILHYHSPYSEVTDGSYRMNIFNALFDKIYREKFGPFVQISEDGLINQSYELFDLLKNDPDKKYTYNYLYFYKKGMNPFLEDYVFFGSKIKRVFYYDIENEPRPYMLNDYIKTILKYVKKLASGNVSNYDNDLKWRCFSMNRFVRDWYKGFVSVDYRNSISEEEYSETLKKLLDRYSCLNETLFEKVTQLGVYKSVVGIYILCIKNKRKIYVGQTKASISRRVLQHFNHKNTDFDNSILPGDINEIYVLRIPQIENMIDVVEADCIATIGPKIVANAAASSYTLESIDENYKPEFYLMEPKLLKQTINEIGFYKYSIGK